MWYIALVINCIISGVLASKLAQAKGYDGYFWTGFFLSIWGLIYVSGLPAVPKAIPVQPAAKGMGKCPACGYEQPTERDTCWKCGANLQV